MKRVLLSLVVIGGVLYAAHALFSADDVEPSAAQPAPTGTTLDQKGAQPAKIDDAKAAEDAQALSAEALTPSPADSRHAIAVEGAPSPAPAETSAGPEATSSPGANGEASPGPSPQHATFMRVTSPASIREGPSTSAAIVGIAQPGAEAQIVARSSDWVEIIDPGSKKTGWIHQSFLAPTESASRPVSPPEVEAALAATPESESATDDDLSPTLKSKPHRHASRHRHHRHSIVLGPFILRFR
ncbi:MAG: SH3 domain-containing protein [Methyloceanibacter sp.]